MSGHRWLGDGEKCALCGDKDWMADKFCSKNPEFKKEYKEWIDSLKSQSLQATGEGDGIQKLQKV